MINCANGPNLSTGRTWKTLDTRTKREVRCSLLYLVHHGVLLPLSYDAFLASLITLNMNMLTLMIDGFKLRLELA
jgi:hypothetical protein